MKIGLISDTHGYWDEAISVHLKGCDEIWHAGDIGSQEVADQLEALAPCKMVFGNIDDKGLQARYPKTQLMEYDGLRILMIHIGGKPPKYAKGIKKHLKETKPHVFVCGHSHILRVMPDEENKLLYLNPGAAGQQGFHKMRTLLLFEIEAGRIQNLRVVELGLRGRA